MRNKETMALNAERKAEIVREYQRGEGDTGSPEVQVALLTANIEQLRGSLRVPQAGSPLPTRPDPHGEPAPQPARLPQAQGHQRATPS
jgi:hypothetical protein